MASKDPFAGIRLSEQASPGKLDQRLFTAEPPQPVQQQPPVPAPGPAPAVEPDPAPRRSRPAPSPAVRHPTPPATEEVRPRSAAPTSARWDLRDEPLYKATFTFTQEELDALTDLKEELRRTYDTKITKYDLIRSALHMLLEDHATNGTRSYATRKARRR